MGFMENQVPENINEVNSLRSKSYSIQKVSDINIKKDENYKLRKSKGINKNYCKFTRHVSTSDLPIPEAGDIRARKRF